MTESLTLDRLIAEAEAELREALAEYRDTSSRDSWAWPAAKARRAAAEERLRNLRAIRAEVSE